METHSPTSVAEKTWKRTMRQAGQRNSQTGNTTVAPKQTQSTPGKNLHQKQQRAILGGTFTKMHNPMTQTIRENTAASKTAETTQASPERTSTRTTKASFWENLPERTSQTNSIP
ncbi:hypothetical protein Taro_020692 [Colocasia esculenta]|uniref:Uncharacterized protein n=1 Tax=Colocasia esculenta TaxID=4460 RepID=A0A843UPB0_COLES|nr:hypothetical protein [Colocasia esculenta]